jgi:hypothetical protein
MAIAAPDRAIGRVKLKSRLSPSNAPEPSIGRVGER